MTSAMTDMPRFRHDCSRCHFLGHFDGRDLYTCLGAREKTVIARHADEGPQYASGMDFSYGSNPWLTQARQRAQALGLLTFDLKNAAHNMRPDAPPEVMDEFKKALLESPEYRALAELVENPEEGIRQLRVLVSAQALVYRARFPHLSLGETSRWHRSFITNLCHWARQLDLPVPQECAIILALYNHSCPTSYIVKNGLGGYVEVADAMRLGYDFNGYNLFNRGTFTPFEVVEIEPTGLPETEEAEPAPGVFRTETGRYYRKLLSRPRAEHCTVR